MKREATVLAGGRWGFGSKNEGDKMVKPTLETGSSLCPDV